MKVKARCDVCGRRAKRRFVDQKLMKCGKHAPKLISKIEEK